MNKAEIRSNLLSLRSSHSENDMLLQSEFYAQKLMAWEKYKQATKIMFFISFGKEINTHTLIKHSIDIGKTIYIPHCHENSNVMDAVPLEDFEKDLISGKHGILTHKNPYPIENINDLELIIVPGLGFSKDYYRIGYGGGYYDRFLENYANITLGYCYDFQCNLVFPHEEHDISMKYIINSI